MFQHPLLVVVMLDLWMGYGHHTPELTSIYPGEPHVDEALEGVKATLDALHPLVAPVHHMAHHTEVNQQITRLEFIDLRREHNGPGSGLCGDLPTPPALVKLKATQGLGTKDLQGLSVVPIVLTPSGPARSGLRSAARWAF